MNINDIIFASAAKNNFYDSEEDISKDIKFLLRYLGNSNNSVDDQFNYLQATVDSTVKDYYRDLNLANSNLPIFDENMGSSMIITDYNRALQLGAKNGQELETIGYYKAGDGRLAVSKVRVKADRAYGQDAIFSVVDVGAPEFIMANDEYQGNIFFTKSGSKKILQGVLGQIPGQSEEIMKSNYPDTLTSLNMASRRYLEGASFEGDSFVSTAATYYGSNMKNFSSFANNTVMDALSIKSNDGNAMSAGRTSTSNSYLLSRKLYDSMVDIEGSSDSYLSLASDNDSAFIDNFRKLEESNEFFKNNSIDTFINEKVKGENRKGFNLSSYTNWAFEREGISAIEVSENGEYKLFNKNNKVFNFEANSNTGIRMPFQFNHSRINEARGFAQDKIKSQLPISITLPGSSFDRDSSTIDVINSFIKNAHSTMLESTAEGDRYKFATGASNGISRVIKTEIAKSFGLESYTDENMTSAAKTAINSIDEDLISSMIMKGEIFKVGESIGRQSAAIQGTNYLHRQSIQHDFGYLNASGQRHAQSDALVSKARVNFGGDYETDLTLTARNWTSGMDEMKYKQLSYKREHLKAFNDMVDSKVRTSANGAEIGIDFANLFEQQAFALYTYSDMGYQDSAMTSTLSALENVSMHDNKNVVIDYSTLNKGIFGNMDEADVKKSINNLNNANAYVDGTIENKIFRNLIGEENYKKAFALKETGLEEWNEIGSSFSGIKSLKTEQERLEYIKASDKSVKKFNNFFDKYAIKANTNARAKVLSPEYINQGQRTSISGVNYALIDGINFTENGIELSTKGIITQGEGAKLMVSNVKATVGNSTHLFGVQNGDIFNHADILINEKVTKKKRGFTGTFLGRSLMTMAFHGATRGDGTFEENFNNWKSTMSSNTMGKYASGEQNIFDALGIDITYSNGDLRFLDKNLVNGDGSLRSHEDIARTLENRMRALFGNDRRFTATSDSNPIAQELVGTLYKGYDNYLSTLSDADREQAIIHRTGGSVMKSSIGIDGTASMNKVHDIDDSYRFIADFTKMQQSLGRKDMEGLRWGRLGNIAMTEQHLGWVSDMMNNLISENLSGEIHAKYSLAAPKDMVEVQEGVERTIKDYSRASSNYANYFNKKLDLSQTDISPVARTNMKLSDYMNISSLTKNGILQFDENMELIEAGIGQITNFEKGTIEIAKKMNDVENVKKLAKTYEIEFIRNKFRTAIESKIKNSEGYSTSSKKEVESFAREMANLFTNKYSEGSFNYDINNVSNSGSVRLAFNDSEVVDSVFRTRFARPSNLVNEIFDNFSDSAGFNKDFRKSFKDSEGVNFGYNFIFRNEVGGRQLEKIFNETLSEIGSDKELKNLNKLMHGISNTVEYFNQGDDSITQFQLFDNLDKNYANLNTATRSILRNAMNDLSASQIEDIFKGNLGDEKSAREFISFFTERLGSLEREHAMNIIDFGETARFNSMPFSIDKVSVDEYGYIVNNKQLTSIENVIKLNSRISDDTKLMNVFESGLGFDIAEFSRMNKNFEDNFSDINVQDSYLALSAFLNKNKKLGNLINVDSSNLKNLRFEDKLSSLDIATKKRIFENAKAKAMNLNLVNEKQFASMYNNFSGNYANKDIVNHLFGSDGNMDKTISYLKNLSRGLNTDLSNDSIRTNAYLLNEATYNSLKGLLNDDVDNIIENSFNPIKKAMKLLSADTLDMKAIEESLIEFNGANGSKIDYNNLYNVLDKNVKEAPDRIRANRQRLARELMNRNTQYSNHYFKKGGSIYEASSLDLKSAIAIDPREGTYIYNFINEEMKDIARMHDSLNGGAVTDELRLKKSDFKKAMNLVFGKEFANEFIENFNENIRKNSVNGDFLEAQMNKLNTMSGYVLGTSEQFEKYGLSKYFGKNDYTYQALSRNPHQYMSSIRGTRYVKLNEVNRNLSFLGKAFGSETKIEGSNNNLLFLGKKTAMSAHGDFDGDVFQALFFTNRDMSNSDNVKKLKQAMEQYHILGNISLEDLESSFENGKQLSGVHQRLANLTKSINNLDGNASNRDIFNSFKDGYYALKWEALRVDEEVLGENKDHSVLPELKKFVSKKSGTYDKTELAGIINRMDEKQKYKLFASTVTNDTDIESLVDVNLLSSNQKALLKKFKDKKNASEFANLILDFYGDGSNLKFNSFNLTESVFDSYTGIARTGFIHNQLTEFREASTFLLEDLSSKIYKNGEMLDIDWLKTIAKKGISYNSFGMLIDSLAISAKLGGGADPYKTTAKLVATSDSLLSLMTDQDHIISKSLVANNVASMWDSIQKGLPSNIKDVKGNFNISANVNGIGDVFGLSPIDFVKKVYLGGAYDNVKGGKSSVMINKAANQLATLINSDLSGDELAKAIKDKNFFKSNSYNSVISSLGNFNGLFVHAGVTSHFGQDPVNGMKSQVFKKGANFISTMKRIVDNFIPQSIRQNTRILHNARETVDEISDRLEATTISNLSGSSVLEGTTGTNIVNSEAEEVIEDTAEASIRKINGYLFSTEDSSAEKIIEPRKRKGKVTTSDTIGRHNRSRGRVINTNNVESNFGEPEIKYTQSKIDFEAYEPASFVETNTSQYDERISQLEDQIAKLTKSNEDLYQNLAEVDQITDDLRREFSKANSSIDELEKNLDALNSKYLQALEDIENAGAFSEAAQEQLASQMEHIEALEDALRNSTVDTSGFEEEIDNLKLIVKNYEDHLEGVDIENNNLKNLLKEAEDKFQELKRISADEIHSLKRGTVANTVLETASNSADKIKEVVGKNKKTAMLAGAGAILGVALRIFQSNRSVVQLDINEEQYERSKGSVYRSLGDYSINTNIRGMR